MRLTTKFSALVTLLTGLAILVTLFGCAASFYTSVQYKLEKRISAVVTLIDNDLLFNTPEALAPRLAGMMAPVDISKIEFIERRKTVLSVKAPPAYRQLSSVERWRSETFPLLKNPGMAVRVTWSDPVVNYFRSMLTTAPLSIAIIFMVMMVMLGGRWIRRQLAGLELLETRASRILNGERGSRVRGSVHEWPTRASSAIDILLSDIQHANEQRTRMDRLIRAFAAQDSKTGLSNRLFFDNQLATLLEDQENVGTHGVVMMIRLPDFDTLRDTWGKSEVEEYLFNLINMFSTFIMRYPGALLARYFRSDFAVLLPHRTLKEAEGIASQLLNALDALPPTRMLDSADMLHIGICTFRSGQTIESVIENAQLATRNAVLQGGNGWSVYDETAPEKGRGNVRWRTLIENVLQRGGPRFYQKPAVTCEGWVHHRELMCRIFDGEEEVLAAEFMPMVRQFGLAEQFDRQLITRIIPFLRFWPEETLAISVSVESLIRPSFQRWLRDSLMQCEKSQRKRILFELAEADVCQHINRLHPVVRLIQALGARIAVVQAGLTVVSTSYIKDLHVEVVKLHPGLVRNIEKRTENQLFVQSLVEACSGTQAQLFAAGIRSRSEWQTLVERGVSGGQGDFFMASQPLDTSIKKYSQRFSV
ncbi:RNase E specificity factor CsrD [Atlantibacter hermannii]|uniref:Regulatory protein CsrD n=2 Tax=Atlantibacter hermannii TaxID=565 RepID=H5V5M0_ATLHE|nr:RNase E specificity factor CsrD [Atlantibacter hermannii]HAI50304.1 RNase E specificity factor CsrD [Enterobacteriaceae bacterium]MBW9429647.1 RNase E specificity factor CsrD [Atlantibacter hermannii]MDU7813805.1 RNase E specificity factor CsrD [Atlantibacter hermannii]MEB7925720.1 RNase E specificity factor CsrD [Atlantibacter hermannii]QPS91415.1 RNase E specificity factor CsrD [Atlantibacter hermannii]